MLGLRVACGYQEVVRAYNEAVKLIHPDKCGMPGTAEAWVIIMDRRQDLNVTWTPAGKSGRSAQDRCCARGFGGGAKKQRANEKEQK